MFDEQYVSDGSLCNEWYSTGKPVLTRVLCSLLITHCLLPPPQHPSCAVSSCVVSYAPLGRPGNLKEGDPVLIQDPVVVRIAEEKGLSPAQVLLQWQIEKGLSAVPKSSSPEHMAENLASMTVTIDSNDISALDTLDTTHRFCNYKWCNGCLVFD